jgi:alpha,alpha-trehalose phosphorylase
VIVHPAFFIQPWQIREEALDLDVLPQTESVFALANGHLGLRGNLDEGEPHGMPGTYLNGFYELRPLPYAEAGYGYPESGQSMINVTNGKLIRLLVDDEPFDIRYGKLLEHDRTLDLRAGTLTREVTWQSPAGQQVRVESTRLVSFTHRAIAAISFEVTGLLELFDVCIDGVVARELRLAGKPAPDTFLEAARRLEVEPGHAAVFEDALAGVEAGRAGGFGFVVGVDRANQAADLQRLGANLVVKDLGELVVPW